MLVALIDLIVWIIILFTMNPGLVNIFVGILFLPFGYFFVSLHMMGDSLPQREIFEQYEQDFDEEDIFEVYLKTQQKDSHRK